MPSPPFWAQATGRTRRSGKNRAMSNDSMIMDVVNFRIAVSENVLGAISCFSSCPTLPSSCSCSPLDILVHHLREGLGPCRLCCKSGSCSKDMVWICIGISNLYEVRNFSCDSNNNAQSLGLIRRLKQQIRRTN